MQSEIPTTPAPAADATDPWGLEAPPEAAPIALRVRDERPARVAGPPVAGKSRSVGLSIALLLTGLAGVAGVTAFLMRTPTAAAPAAAPSGTLIVSSHPSGASVRIDGEDAGTTPLAVASPAGRHTIEVAGAPDGSAPQQAVAEVVAGQVWRRHFEIAPLVRAAGALRVETTRPGVEVRLDGLVVGRTPLALDDLPAGLHTVQVRLPSGTATRDVTIEGGQTATLVLGGDAPVTPAAPVAPLSAWLAVTVPFDVQVYEAGRLLGVSRSERIMVTAGGHELDFVNDTLGYRRSRTVTIEPGRTATVTLDVPNAPVAVNALPWADVTIDGLPYGETPVASARLSIGEHQVVLRHPTLGVRTESFMVGLTGANRLSVDLRR